MANHSDAGDNRPHTQAQPANADTALHADAYSPKHLNHRVLNDNMTVQPGRNCEVAPSLNSLTIDVGNVHIKDTPRRDATAAERAAAAKREMPVSNEHYRELVKSGSEFLAINGGFNLSMKNALEEARQSYVSMKSGHKHVDDLLKRVNADNCGGFYSLRRVGNNIQIMDTHNSETRPSGTYNLTRRDWVR